MLGKDLTETIDKPFWQSVRPAIASDTVLDIIRKATNVASSHKAAKRKFKQHPGVAEHFSAEAVAKRRLAGQNDANAYPKLTIPDWALQLPYCPVSKTTFGRFEDMPEVHLKLQTREKLECGVHKAIQFANEKAKYVKREKEQKRRDDRFMGREIVDKEAVDLETEKLIEQLTAAVDAEFASVALSVSGPVTSVDKPGGIELTHGGSQEIARAMHPLPATPGVTAYFEVTVTGNGIQEEQVSAAAFVTVGVSSSSFDLKRLPGCDSGSVSYHGSNGNLYVENESPNRKLRKYKKVKVSFLVGRCRNSWK